MGIELEKIIGLHKTMKYLDGLKPALPPLSDLKAPPSLGGGGGLAPLGSKGGLKILGQKAPLVKPAHVNPNPSCSEPNVARSLDFNSELMDHEDESFMSSILGC